MKIIYAKFFQPVQIISPRGTDTVNSLSTKEYSIELDGLFLKIQSTKGGQTTYVTTNNLCYMRVEDETIDAPAEAGRKNTVGKKEKQD